MTQQRIAIIGAGVSGLVSAYLLQHDFEVHVFEQEDRLGGHANTVEVSLDHEQHLVDTGFIVMNDRNYPEFQKLLKTLKVPTLATEMSFSVKDSQSSLEYNGHNLDTLFAQRKNIFSPTFIRFTLDILKFNKIALATSQDTQALQDTQTTLKSFLLQHGFLSISNKKAHSMLLSHYLLPMAAAIWSTSTESVLDFPAAFFIDFFKHHGLLELKNRPQWSSIQGGSQSYVTKLRQQTHCHFHTQTEVARIDRHDTLDNSIELTLADHKDGLAKNTRSLSFNHVILACHSDQALKLLSKPTEFELETLGALPYSENCAILHTDKSLMPVNNKAWASWNYLLPPASSKKDHEQKPIITYDMRRLQCLEKASNDSPEILVSLNAEHLIDPKKVIRKFQYSHPQFQNTSHWAQTQWFHLNGDKNTHFCGAYWFNGFHEDGVRSALRVANAFGDYSL